MASRNRLPVTGRPPSHRLRAAYTRSSRRPAARSIEALGPKLWSEFLHHGKTRSDPCGDSKSDWGWFLHLLGGISKETNIMLELHTRADLDALHHNQVQESSSLEYKASAAVENTEPRKTEIAKDVSAMANADGGQIIYGMTESNHLPTGLDSGIDGGKFNGLWFEQVIQQNIRPQIEGLHILSIPLNAGHFAYVITVPAAGVRAPHQLAKDGRYYRRRNFRNDVMEDYEVRESMRRSTTPELHVKLLFKDRQTVPVTFSNDADALRSAPEIVSIAVSNNSREPALYSVLRIAIDKELSPNPRTSGFYFTGEYPAPNGNVLRHYDKTLISPTVMPIFLGPSFVIGEFEISIPQEHRDRSLIYPFTTEILTPGYQKAESGIFRFERNILSVQVQSD